MDETYLDILNSTWSQVQQNAFFTICVTILIAYGIQQVAHHFTARIVKRSVRSRKGETKSDEKKREDTLIIIIRRVISVAVWLTVLFVVLSQLGVNISALLAGAGVFSFILGFGAQNTIRDYLAGMFILLENQYRVGDVVTLSGGSTGMGTSGVVTEISLRITKLRDLEGNLHVIRNGEASVITNMTFHYSSVVVDINVGYDTKVEKIESIMNEVGLRLAKDEKWKALTIEPIQFLRIDRFTDVAVVARAMGKVSPASQWDIGGAYRRELMEAFNADNIHVGIPHVVVGAADQK